jgi:type III restriction enzyme
MKFKFKQQQYQADATNAVVNIFAGQAKGHRKDIVGRTGLYAQEIFSNKRIDLSLDGILQNVKEIQKDNHLSVNKKLEGLNFTVEMETGTGKTYVYTKTMFELNQQYGWSKFIVMVPSVAIREGVNKSLETTAEHFQEIYGKKIRFSIYNTKNKSNLVNIKQFANTSNIEVIIMNYQAFNRRGKEALKIFQRLDSLQSEKPIDIIKRARPILIIDEPQRFGNAESMFGEFDPLFTLRYSATHRKDYNKIYRLDAIDAFNQKLVKKINVKGIEVLGGTGTNSYLFLDRINVNKDLYPTANIELEIKQASGIKKVIRKINEKDNLYIVSNNLPQYEGCVVKEINAFTNKISFINGIEIAVGQATGNIEDKHIRRIQIRETIKSHLEKEKIMFKKGIKVLSLFFIDEVSKYRKYDESGNQLKADYEQIFEEEYVLAISQQDLFDEKYNQYLNKFKVEEIHKGYFSIDKKGKLINSKEKRGSIGSDDASAYDLIMKHKEKLLGFSEPTRFIFSHSALREGWDNPNVFQICTLKHSQSTISKRQEIGRGLRICVNKDGERMDYQTLENDFFNMNTLTIVANESYDTFANELQREIWETLSDRPTKLTQDVLKKIKLTNNDGEKFIFDDATSMDLIIEFKDNDYLDKEYKITDKLIEDIEKNELVVPLELESFKNEIGNILQKIYSTANFKAATNAKEDNVYENILNPNENFAKEEFQDLWSKIKVKTVYEVDFDSDELIKKSVDAINKQLEVRKVVINITEGTQEKEIDKKSLKTGTGMKKTRNQIRKTENILGSVKYDLLAEIAKGARITRKTTALILKKISPQKFNQFKLNPEDFIQKIIRFINEEKATTLINNITYSKTDQVYSDEIFTINNFNGSLKKNILRVKKHVYDYVKTDSNEERIFAGNLEKEEVMVYAKLPNKFKIPTPIGNYNPDWAIVFDRKDVKYIYFIAETKGSMSTMDLKKAEELRIEYAKKHFKALNNADIKYDVVKTYEDMMDKVF